MIRNKLLRKYFLLATTIVILFLVLGFFLTGFIAQALRPQKDFKEMLPPIFMAQIVDHLNFKTKLEAVQNLKDWHQDKMAPEFSLLDEQGQIVFATSNDAKMKIKIEQAQLQQMKKAYDYFYLKNTNENQNPPPHMPGGPGFMMPPPPPPMGFHQDIAIIRLEGAPVYYLAIWPRPFREPPQMTTQEKLIPLLGIGSLVLSLLIRIGATLFIIYISVFKKIKEADQVISDIQSGNLKARFKIVRKDEFGEAMLRFNKMADEIEKLVEQMKFVELARTKLLQELAHDLRTPISALKSLLDTLDTKDSVLAPQVKKEIIALSIRETKYFEQLIEDLLLLSQVSEPQYGQDHEKIVLKDILNEEIDDQILRHQNDSKEKKIQFIKQLEPSDFALRGNTILFKRMLKNIFDNAASFAASQVRVVLKQSGAHFEMIIEDDGVGFSEEQLKSFGLRKMSRQIIREKNNSERLSIVLVSVVIKKICDLHRGELHVENVQNSDASRTGARIRILFS